MNSQLSEIPIINSAYKQRKTLGVIVLTDNRIQQQQKPSNKHDDRTADCKETQQHPNFQQNQACFSSEDNHIAQLSKRLLNLQQRIKILQNCSGLATVAEEQPQPRPKKKNRRTFNQLHRNHKCGECGKIYGSQTSLRCHLKLKHLSNDENAVFVS